MPFEEPLAFLRARRKSPDDFDAKGELEPFTTTLRKMASGDKRKQSKQKSQRGNTAYQTPIARASSQLATATSVPEHTHQASAALGRAAKRALSIVVALALALPAAAICALAPTQSALAAGDVTLISYGDIEYGGYKTGNYHIDQGGVHVDCYCADPDRKGPSSGTYGTTSLYTVPHAGNQHDTAFLARVLWYGFGGPGFDSRMWPSTDEAGNPLSAATYYACTHILASDVFSCNGQQAVFRTSMDFQQWAYTQILGYNSLTGESNEHLTTQDCMASEVYLDGTAVPADKRMPSDFEGQCFLIETGSDTQRMVGHYSGGYIDLQKVSANAAITSGNGCYGSFAGTTYGIYSDAGCTSQVATLALDSGGYAKSGYLNAGTYYVRETKAPAGYALDSRAYPVTVTAGATKRVNGSTVADAPLNDPTFIALTKYDGEREWSASNAALGGASLEGAEYAVEYYDGAYGSADTAQASGSPTRTWVFATDEDGVIVFESADNYLVSGELYWQGGRPTFPLGTYVAYETKAPSGYLLSGSVYCFGVEQDGQSTKLTGDVFVKESNAYVGDAEQAKRGDLELTKVRESDMARLANVPFRLTSETTGESHVIVTDENGYATTASSWNAHSTRTNANDSAEEGAYDLCSGVWFGLEADGSQTDANDSLGALPFDAYTLEELPCAANEGLSLVKVDHIAVKRDGVTVDLGTVDDRSDQQPYVHTTATDAADGDKLVSADSQAVVNDHVEYMNLDSSTTYTLKASLVWADTGEEVEGSATQVTFRPSAGNGYVNVTIAADLTGAGGRDVVAFETLYKGDFAVAEHRDVEDAEQTVRAVAPAIQTSAADAADGDRAVAIVPGAQVVDTVAYAGLVPGAAYALEGALMLKGTDDEGSACASPLLDSDGEAVTAQATFTAEGSSGSAQVAFDVDPAWVEDGWELVVYETLYRAAQAIAEHADPTAAAQTVILRKPLVQTAAADAADGDKSVLSAEGEGIVDAVSYAGVVAGREYTVHGELMVRSVGEGGEALGSPLLDANGLPVTASTTFIALDSYGTAQVLFDVDASSLEPGTELVCYETLLCDGVAVAEHADIDDGAQTVEVGSPALDTVAADAEDGDKELYAKDGQRIRDAVSYSGLVAGRTYALTCTLMVIEPEEEGGGGASEAHEAMEAAIEEAESAFELPGSLDPMPEPEEEEEAPEPEAHPYLGEDGLPVQSTVEFCALDSYGAVEVPFELDATGLEGCRLVCFEELSLGGAVLATHADLEDADQTVEVAEPAIGTELTDSTDGDHEVLPSTEARLTDTVAYSHLQAGREYMLKGWLVDKATGKPLSIADRRVEGSTTFTANSAEGAAEVHFQLDASALGEGRELVAFEELYLEGELVAEHKDIDDESQTVATSSAVAPKGTAYPKTGGSWTLVGSIAMVAAYAAAAGTYHLIYRRADMD